MLKPILVGGSVWAPYGLSPGSQFSFQGFHVAMSNRLTPALRSHAHGKGTETSGIDLDRLGTLLKKDIRAGGQQLWEALRLFCVQHYGSTEAGFRAHSCPKDGLMSFGQLQELCELAGIHVDSRILRSLFDNRVRDGECTWSIRDFQDSLVVRLDRLCGRVEEYNGSAKGILQHIDGLVRHLALGSGELNRRRAVARFQRKLSLGFCMELWEGLRQASTRKGAAISQEHGEVDCVTFKRIADHSGVFQGYELDFFGNFFDRIDRNHHGHVNMWDLLVALALIGTDATRQEKMHFIFCVYDMDRDGCLTREEILKMCLA